MTVTLNDPIEVAPGALLITWSSDLSNPTFDISKNGKHITSTKMTRISLMCDASDMFEVTDDGSAPSDGADSAIEISWPPVLATKTYKVEEESSPGSEAWTTRATINDDGGSRFSFKAAPLADNIATTFRVTPIGTNGNSGTAKTFNVTVPRHPSAPNVDITFSGATKKVTIATA